MWERLIKKMSIFEKLKKTDVFILIIRENFIIFTLVLLVYIISRYVLSFFAMDLSKFILSDSIFVTISLLIAYHSSNKNKIITVIFALPLIFYIFVVQPVGITTQNTPLLHKDLEIFYFTLITISSIQMKIIVATITVIYFGSIALSLVYFIKGIIKMKWAKKLIILSSASIVVFIFLLRPIEPSIWNISFKSHMARNGIVSSLNYRINHDRQNKNDIKESQVVNALAILKEQEAKRDISNILLRKVDLNDVKEKRDVFLIFLESFYDYSHFTHLFNEDPFSKEYREWGEKSAKIGPNTGSGSFYARLTALTASSLLYPTTLNENIEYMLPHLLKENGYYTLALEEEGVSYSLDTFLPRIGFEKVVFEVGESGISEYLRKSLDYSEKPLFVYGFTFLGHTGSYKEEHKINTSNVKNFIDLIEKKDRNALIETLSTSIATAKEIIKTRNIILEYSKDALIIFKHDHIYPYLSNIIKDSSINNNVKNQFLSTYTPNPILVWDGTNGAYKLPKNFSPENIPLFIALNMGVQYKETPISLLYKDNTDNTIRFYGSIYETNSSGEVELVKDYGKKNIEEIAKYENAQKVLSEDIFTGKKFFYKLNVN